MTAALSSMGALAAMPPLPSITNKPPPGLPQLNMAALEVVKKKVTKQANSISIKEFTDVRDKETPSRCREVPISADCRSRVMENDITIGPMRAKGRELQFRPTQEQ